MSVDHLRHGATFDWIARMDVSWLDTCGKRQIVLELANEGRRRQARARKKQKQRQCK